MQSLIASYLFQQQRCPLPGIGTLVITNKSADSDFVNKVLSAPTPTIQLSTEQTDADALINYIATKTNSSNSAAKEALEKYCSSLNATEAVLPAVGTFSVDANGTIQFTPQPVNSAFTQSVKAERVIHPEAAHHMVVGDKETNTAVMTEYYAEEETVKDRWWIWAIVLAVLAIVTIVIYFSGQPSPSFGNAVSYKLA